MNWQKNFEDNLSSDLIDILILNLLTEQDMYGYELMQILDERTHGVFSGPYARIFGPLMRMMSKGYISSYEEPSSEEHSRHYYHIENSGREYLEYGRSQSRLMLAEYLNNI